MHFLLTESRSDGAFTVGDLMAARLDSSAMFLASKSFRRARPSMFEARSVSDPNERAAVGNCLLPHDHVSDPNEHPDLPAVAAIYLHASVPTD